MKKSNSIITIPKPCSENWSTMTPVQQGRFCQSCQKKVFDFTASTDREIANAFKSTTSLCGQFASTQLNRELIVPKEKSSIWMATTSTIISFLGLGIDEILAQEQPKTEQNEKRVVLGMIATTPKQNNEIAITGTVYDNVGTLPGANVVIKGTEHSVQTDMDGKFTISAKENDVVVVSFIGAKDKEIHVKKGEKNLEIILEYHVELTLGIVVVRKRTFFGRIFQSIGNLFR